ncbi:MAG: alanine racemase [Bacteroidetes bacterium]|jgi:alanine racemase|nr:alanine racemase [Bacteroidota bacterium]
MLHTSFIELSKDALNNNIRFIRRQLPPEVRYSMVVKANAYGHGIEDLLPAIEECGVTHFSVFSTAEAMRVHEAKHEQCEVMIMGWIDDDYLEWAITRDVSFFVFTPERLTAALQEARRLDHPARVHLELETGMHRTGFCEDQLDGVIQQIAENKTYIKLEGLCTHYAGAEDYTSYDRVGEQISTFNRLCSRFEASGITPRYKHSACSAALFNFPETAGDLVRVGISSYGYWPNIETKMRYTMKHDIETNPLDRILTWKSKILSVNNVAENEYVSYGKSYLTNRPSKIATVPVGYGYGFSRTLSNNGHVLVGGKRVPVIGKVNMNMIVLDVTDVDLAAVGDEVVLVGRQGDLEISISSFSDMNNSMNYELLTRLPNHIPRQVV